MAQFKNDLVVIKTPRGAIVQRKYTKGKNKGKVYLRLEWNKDFAPSFSWGLQRIQAELDQEVIRLVSPYVPFQTGILEKSALIATDIGSGEILHATPYAAAQYYLTDDTRDYDPQRGGHWGDRMVADKLPQVEAFVQRRVKEYDNNR